MKKAQNQAINAGCALLFSNILKSPRPIGSLLVYSWQDGQQITKSTAGGVFLHGVFNSTMPFYRTSV